MNTENQHPEKTECDGISCPVCGRVGTRPVVLLLVICAIGIYIFLKLFPRK